VKIKQVEGQKLWEYAVRLLGSRAYSAGEMRDKLTRKAARREEVPEILARLKEYAFLDDSRFAEAYAASRLENQGFGKRRVLQDLRRRRVAPGLAEKMVEKTYAGTDETELILDHLKRKYRSVDLAGYLSDPKHLASAYRRLCLAGFGPGNVLQVLRRFASEPGLLDNLETQDEPPADS
jgi:regulatory protein